MQKKSLLVLVIMAMLLIVGCSKDNSTVTAPDSGATGTGMMKLGYDKVSVPSGINTLKATLTRSGYTTLTSSVNIGNDTTGVMVLQDIATGTWHLKVEALNANLATLYAGETDVTVVANTTTQVSLNLTQLVQTGSIQINITWTPATQNSNWADVSTNPVFLDTDPYTPGGSLQSYVIKEDGVFKMWYTTLSSGGYATVSYATSVDGIHWVKPQHTPVIYPSPTGWDAAAICAGPVMKIDNQYKMYYTGWNSQSGTWGVGLATSSDGIAWTKKSSPVLNVVGAQFLATDVKIINNEYNLYFTSIASGYSVKMATSPDGLNFDASTIKAILTATNSWEGSGVSHPTIVKVGEVYKMIYQNVGGTVSALGMATSSDGKNWTKDANYFFKATETTNNWANNSIAYPNAIVENGKIWVYYTGSLATYVQAIGLVKQN